METIVIDLATKTEYTILVNKSGENTTICPVCSHTRKKKTDKCFSFNLQKGTGFCHHCNISLVEKKEFEQKTKIIDFKRPLFKNSSEYSQRFKTFFKSRLISEKTLLKLKVTESNEWMPQFNKIVPTINFNYFRYNQLINVKYRGAEKTFKLFKDAELILYNLDCVLESDFQKKNEIIICEGEIDCLSIIESGITNVVSVPNGAGLGKINLEYLDNSIEFFNDNTKFIIATDNDKAGFNLKNELIRRLGSENCYTVTFKDCKDANECLVKYGIQGVIESIAEKKEIPISGVFDAESIKSEIYDYYINGLPTVEGIGMAEIDMHIKFHEGYLTTITGIPGHGKSEFLDFLLCRLNISQGWKAALYSPENHPLELHFSKFAEKMLGKPFEGVNKMSSLDLDCVIKYHSQNFYFIKPENDFTLESILNSVKSLVRKKGVKAFVIDAWNKLDHQYTGNETQYISKQLDTIVNFCERNKVHCFLVVHPTKMQKDKATGAFEVPNLYSLSGSANFYNKTANGITVYRNYENGQSEIHIQKVKFKNWGQTGCVHLGWDRITGRYYKGMPSYESWLNIDKKLNRIIENNDFLTPKDIVINDEYNPF